MREKKNKKIGGTPLVAIIILLVLAFVAITNVGLKINGVVNAQAEQENVKAQAIETTKPYIPKGFTEVKGTNLETGYTIRDAKGNQYVWIEVPMTTEVYSTAGLEITSFTEGEYTKIEKDLHTYTNDYRNGTKFKDEYYSDATTGLTKEQYYTLKKKMLKSVYQNGGFYIGKYETGIESAPKTSGSADTLPTETPVIKQSVYPYNYVTCSQAQKLASKMESGNNTSSLMFGVQWDLVLKYLEKKGTSKEDLKINSTSWGNYQNNEWKITNTGLKYARDNYYTLDSWTNIKDAKEKLKKEEEEEAKKQKEDDKNKKNKTETKVETKEEEEARKKAEEEERKKKEIRRLTKKLVETGVKDSTVKLLLETGSSNKFSKQGIYDLAGNVWEWTLEYTSNPSAPCARRGGSYYGNGSYSPVLRRFNNIATDYYDFIGFRVAIF